MQVLYSPYPSPSPGELYLWKADKAIIRFLTVVENSLGMMCQRYQFVQATELQQQQQ